MAGFSFLAPLGFSEDFVSHRKFFGQIDAEKMIVLSLIFCR